jgi:cytochrome P450
MDVDLFSPEAVKDPWPAIEQIRRRGPVVWSDRMQRWMVTSDRLVRRILFDSERFTVEGDGDLQKIFGPEAFVVIDEKTRHDRLRAVWSVAFQRASLERLRGVIADIADRMIDEMESRLRAGESVEAMGALCRDLPAYVIAYMLGVPADMRPRIVEWSDLIAASLSLPPDQWSDANPAWVAANRARENLANYIVEQINYRRASPGEDLISQIVHSDVGRTLSDQAIMENARQLLFAGNETTAKWIGQCLVVLARSPEVRAAVLRDRALLGPATEEIMRWQPVSGATYRTLRGGDLDLEGVLVRDGDMLMIMTGAANRDPERYPEPDRLDIHREFKANLGFGYGMHSCIGVTLARLETQVTIDRLLDRIPDFELAGEVTYTSFQVRGPLVAPIKLAGREAR